MRDRRPLLVLYSPLISFLVFAVLDKPPGCLEEGEGRLGDKGKTL